MTVTNKSRESRLGGLYRRAYEWLCGRHPYPRPWHFQYLDAFYLYRSLKQVLPKLANGVVLDVGCGDAPYRKWLGEVEGYIGIDTHPGKGVDCVVAGHTAWPIADKAVDTVICTQVLEHVEDLSLFIQEIDRVLRRGGRLLVSFPFIYNEHGAPQDFRRFSVHGALLLWPDWEIDLIERQGGIGSTLALLWLNWFEATMNHNYLARLLKAPLLPFWVLVSLAANMLGLVFDWLDHTGSFYSNVFVAFKKTPRDSH